MKLSFVSAVLIAFSLAACGQKPADTTPFQAPAPMSAVALPVGHPAIDAAKIDAAKAAQKVPEPPLTQKAQVLSARNVTQYTYLEVTQGGKNRWLATTAPAAVAAKKGDTIQFDNGTVMNNFNSKVMNRTFPSITLVGRVVIDSGSNAK